MGKGDQPSPQCDPQAAQALRWTLAPLVPDADLSQWSDAELIEQYGYLLPAGGGGGGAGTSAGGGGEAVDPVKPPDKPETPPDKPEDPIPVKTVKSLVVIRADDHFAPGKESLDVQYKILGLSGDTVKVEVTSPYYSGGPIYTGELTSGEKSDGSHTLHWDGKANCSAGELKGAYIHPLYSPYKVKISGGGFQGEEEFSVLYHSIMLKRGPWTPDEKEPSKDKEKEWAQYKLNELGYHGGPVGKDTDGYLKKAVIRYKDRHKKMHKRKHSSYNGAITDELKKALAAGDNRQIWLDETAFERVDAESEVNVEALTYRNADEFLGAKKETLEKARVNRPLVPVEAVIYIKTKNDTKVESPGAVGPVRINWRFIDEKEDLGIQAEPMPGEPSRTKLYLERALKLHGGRAGKNGDNCHVKYGGLRTKAAKYFSAPFLLGSNYVPYTASKDTGQKVVFSKACVDQGKYPKRVGRAGIFFRPSFIAGDAYRLKAEIDFKGLPNKGKLESLHKVTGVDTRINWKTGTFRVRRYNKIAMLIKWPGRSGELPLEDVAYEYTPAWLDIDTYNITKKKITDVLTEAQYRKIVKQNTKHKTADKVHLKEEYLGGVKVPEQTTEECNAYAALVNTYFTDKFLVPISFDLGDQLSETIRKEHPWGFIVVDFLLHKPITIKQNPPEDNTVVATNWVGVGCSFGLPGAIVLISVDDSSKDYATVAHEMAHAFWLQHWENAPGKKPLEHDKKDHNCMMSYISANPPYPHQGYGVYTPHFCGKCNLKLRGWKVTKLPPHS